MLNKFYAVTRLGGIWEIGDEINQNGWPMVKLIGGSDEWGMSIGFCLKFGKLVGIGTDGICLFDPDRDGKHDFEDMSILLRGGSTSSIVGLFLSESEAEICLASKDHVTLSLRFRTQTRATLDEIGDEHPIFVIGRSLKFADLWE